MFLIFNMYLITSKYNLVSQHLSRLRSIIQAHVYEMTMSVEV